MALTRPPSPEEQARTRLELAAAHRNYAHALDAILATTTALAVLLDPATMLAAWERAGKVAPGLIGAWWRIVHHAEEGASDVTYEEKVSRVATALAQQSWTEAHMLDEQDAELARELLAEIGIVPDEKGSSDG